jgi:ABC-type nitrate/sulfonate/bicarbonate transport system substrate-binding protein
MAKSRNFTGGSRFSGQRRSFLTTGLKFAGLAASGALAAPFISSGRANAATPLNFQLSWIKTAQYSGYFSGIEQGFYKDVGLEMTFTSGGPNVDPIANVAAGRSQIGDRPAGPLVVAREKGIPIKIIGTVFQKNPFSLMSMPETPIRTIKETVGKTIAVGLSSRPMLLGVLKDHGIDPKSVNIIPSSPDPSGLVTKQIDGYMGYETNQGVILAMQGFKVHNLNLHDLGYPEPAGNIYAREDFLAANKDAVVAFLRAAAKSWRWTLDNPEPAAKILVEKHGVSGLTMPPQIEEIRVSKPFMEYGIAAKQGLLSLDLPVFDKVLDSYRKVEVIKSNMTAADLCDPRYIIEAHAKAS